MSYEGASHYPNSNVAEQQQQSGETAQDQQYNADYYNQYYQYYQGYGYDYSQYGQQQAATGTEQQQQQEPAGDGDQAAGAMHGYDAYYGYNAYGMGYPGMFPQMGFPAAPPPPLGLSKGQEPSRSIWIGNMNPDTTEAEIHAAFARFGMIENIKVLPAKGCAFIKFYELDAAISAHNGSMGTIIHGQAVKVGWGKDPSDKDDKGPPPCRNLWLGNLSPDVSEEQLFTLFGKYGAIDKIKLLPQKGCAFVNFVNLDAAVAAKQNLQGVLISDRPIKINYGKETPKELEKQEKALANVEPPPPEVPPPDDPELRNIIDKSADYVARNGIVFETHMKEKQKDNPKFGFLNPDHEHHIYYQLRLWRSKYPDIDPQWYWNIKDQVNQREAMKHFSEMYENQDQPPQQQQPSYGSVPPPNTYNAMPPPNMHQSTNQNYQQNHHQQPQQEDEMSKLSQLINTLVPTKDSIKVTKNWIIQHGDIAKDVASFLKQRVERASDFDTKLNILYLIHDVLHHALRNVRGGGETSDIFADAFLPNLPKILQKCYDGQSPENQDKIAKVVKIWGDKSIYSSGAIQYLEEDMRSSSSSHKSRDQRDSRDRDRDRDRERDDRKRRDRDRDYDRHESKRRH